MTAVMRPFDHAAVAPERAAAGARSEVNPVVRAAFYLFVFSIPFEMPQRTVPYEIPTLVGVLFLATTLLNPTACFRRVPAAGRWFIAYLWVFAMVAVVIAGDYPVLVWHLFLVMLQLVLIFWVATNLLRDERVWRGVLLALVLACCLRAGLQVAGIAVTAREQWTGGERITALGQNANLSAMILSAGLVGVVGLRLGVFTWPLVAMLGVAIIQTGSRGGLLCAAVGMLMFLWQGRTVWLRVRNAAVGLAAISLLSWGAVHSTVMRARFQQAATEHTLAGRERIYPALIEMFGERPLLGWGPIDNQFEIARRIGDQLRPRRDAHNLVGELLTATGIAGAIPFLIGLALCVRAGWRGRKGPHGIVSFALLCAVLVGTISGTWIAAKVLWLALAFALAAGTTPGTGVRPCAV